MTSSSGAPDVAANLRHVRASIADACARSGREASAVRLVAITKTVPVDLVRAARSAGVEDFGENYAKELAAKAPAIPARWHFVGRLQVSNAARIARHAQVVHSAEPGKGLERVARTAGDAGRRVDVLVQVDFTGARQGVAADDVEPFLLQLGGHEGVRVVGLMTLPPVDLGAEGARPFFGRLRQLRDRLRERSPGLRELSMGMSADYPVAVEEGATMVRVGTALFGPRPSKPGDAGGSRPPPG